jgi:hypothetical protein
MKKRKDTQNKREKKRYGNKPGLLMPLYVAYLDQKEDSAQSRRKREI